MLGSATGEEGSVVLRLSRAIAALIVTLALVSGVAPAATAAEPLHRQARSSNDYVALGDSFAAGYGAGIPSGACGRSSFGYPSLIAKIGHLDLTLAACSGATMADVARTQLSALTDGTDFVTIQVGGNDVGFVPVLGVCAQPDSDTRCAGAVAQSTAYLNNGFATNAAGLFGAVRAAAPNAKLIVVGYPRLFGSKDCSPLTQFTGTERHLLNDATDLLNRRLAEAARATGASFTNPTKRFDDHAWCDRLPWINGPVPVGAFHPNLIGQVFGYLPVVGRYFLD